MAADSGKATAPAPRPADTGTLVPVDGSTASDRPATLATATPGSSSQAAPPPYGVAGQPVTATGARGPVAIAPQQPVTATRSPAPIAAAPPAQRPSAQAPVAVPQPAPDVRTASVPVTPTPSAPAPSTSIPETSSAAAPSASTQERPQPPPSEPAKHRAGVSEREAIGIARDFMLNNDVYDVDPDCLSIRSNGYVNVGYALEAWNVCASGGSGRLGRWRVDALTGQLFRQDEDGRYRKP